MSHSGAIPKNRGGARAKTSTRKCLPPMGRNDEKTNVILTNSNYALTNGNTNDATSFTQHPTMDGPLSRFSENEPLLPMEQRNISLSEGGVQMKRPALHISWVENRMHINYTSPPNSEVTGDYVVGAIEAWIEQMEFYLEDLSWLLNLPHHRFWSQMVFCKATSSCIESYLIGGPRWYDELPYDDSCLSVINKIHQLIFLIYVRMATYKESKIDFITPSVFGDIIYDNFLFDICKILDLCVIYGMTNESLLKKVINNVFTHQPKYYIDLQQLITELIGVMKNMEIKLDDSDYFSSDAASPVELSDIFHYLVDTFSSLHLFLKIFPKSTDTFHEKDFEIRISSFYEKVVPKMIENLYLFINSPEDKSLEESLVQKVHTARMSMLAVFRDVVVHSCHLFQNSDDNSATIDETGKNVEKFINIMTTSAEERTFITDYNMAYNIDEDISYFERRDVADMTTLNFIRDVVLNASSELELDYAINNLDQNEILELQPNDMECKKKDDTSGMSGYYKGESNTLTDIELASLISHVQDLLPDLGIGFIKECLKYYNYSTEEVLIAVLEDNLPPCLSELDTTMELPLCEDTTEKEILPTANSSNKETENELSSVLSNRLNIYDDDEFDIWRQPVKAKKNKIYKGKKLEENVYEKDPELDKRVKDIVREYESNQGYSIYEDEEKYLPTAKLDYEDEYDDTYDGDVIGDIDNFGNDKKNYVVPTIRGKGALNTPGLNFMPESSDEDDGNPEGEPDTREKKEEKELYGHCYRRTNAMYNKGFTGRSRGSTAPSTGTRVFTTGKHTGNQGHRQEASSERNSKNKDSRQWSSAENKNANFSSTESAGGRDTKPRMERDTSSNTENDYSTYTGATSRAFPHRSVKHSGKSWRQGNNENAEENRDYRGGKYKEDTNHGKAQDPSYRHKMIHKNDHRRNAAFAKTRNNF